MIDHDQIKRYFRVKRLGYNLNRQRKKEIKKFGKAWGMIFSEKWEKLFNKYVHETRLFSDREYRTRCQKYL